MEKIYTVKVTSAGGYGKYHKDYGNIAIMSHDKDHFVSQIRDTKKQEIIQVIRNIHIGSTEKSEGFRILQSFKKQTKILNEVMV